MIDTLLQLVFISLGCAFVANVLTNQNGPAFIFSSLRVKISVLIQVKSLAIGEEINSDISERRKAYLLKKTQVIKSFADLIVCPFCLGTWLVLIVSILVFPVASLVQNWLVGCGLLYVWLGLINGRS